MLELAYKKYGNHPRNLIILHGLFGTLDNWHTLATQFSASFTVWTIDQRNHGKSPHSDEFNYHVMSQDLADFMQQHSIEKADIIGHSMGGKTAMQFSFDFPEKISKLIIADISPRAYGPSHNELIDALHDMDLSRITRRSDAEEMLSHKIKEPATIQFLLKNLTREENAYTWKMNLPAITKNYETIIGAVDDDKTFSGPTLFIRGGKSTYILAEDEAQIKKQFPNTEIKTIANSGHWVHAEAPKEFYEVVTDFLS